MTDQLKQPSAENTKYMCSSALRSIGTAAVDGAKLGIKEVGLPIARGFPPLAVLSLPYGMAVGAFVGTIAKTCQIGYQRLRGEERDEDFDNGSER